MLKHILLSKILPKYYMTYTYDSCKRFPIEYLQNSICDEICSFDLDDVTKYSFKIIPNSIYIEK
jgi:hypothetical protein